MNWLANNWYLVVAAIAVIAAIVFAAVKFFKLPTQEQIKNFKEWLKWAVAEAEKELGSGTGQLKLRLVYNWAVEKFPWVANFVSFNMFSMWVDEALEWMKKQLEENKAIKKLVVYEEESRTTIMG